MKDVFVIVLTENSLVSPDPGGRYETMGQVGKRIREDLQRGDYSLKREKI